MFSTPKTVEFSIPVDHPKAGKMRAIFEKLATSKQRLSGLVIESGREDDAAVDYVLGELRNLLLDEGVDLNDLIEKEFHRKPFVSDIQGFLSNPVMIASVLSSVLNKGNDDA